MALGIRTAVANAVMGWAAKRASAPVFGSSLNAGSPIFSEWSSERAVREGYKASYILYAVASDLASISIRQVPWYVGRMMRDGVEVVDSHPLVEMLRSPNPDQPWGALTENWDLYKSLAGNAYGRIVLVGDRVDVWPLRPDRMRPIPDRMGHLSAWEYSVEEIREKIPAEAVLHFRFFDPGQDILGLAPLQAAARIVDASNFMVSWNAEAMKNRAVPDLALSPKNPLSAEQHRLLLQSLQQKMTGPQNARKTLIPSEPLELIQLAMTPVEMDFIRSFETYEAAICKAFHVHPEAIGALGATFENKEWAIRAKWEGPIQARLTEMRSVLNHKLRPMFGTTDPGSAKPGEIFLDFDLSQTPAAHFARAKALELAQKAWACGVPWDLADATFGVGIGPIPGGDVGYLSVGLLPATQAGVYEEEARGFNPSGDKAMELHWRATDRRKKGWERGVAAKVAARFGEEQRAVVGVVAGGSMDLDVVLGGQRAAWEELMVAVLRTVVEDFGKQTQADINQRSATRADAYEFDPWSAAIRKWVQKRAGDAVKGIQDTTKKALREAIVDGLDAGDGMPKIAKAIAQTYETWQGGTGAYRAMLIARTEVHAAASFGAHESAVQSGVVEEKAWLSSMDPPRAREEHMAISGEWIPLDQPYRMTDGTEMERPGDGPAEHVINCRCVEMFRAR